MRILIADRNQLYTRLVRMKLEKWGHTVDIAMDGDSARLALSHSTYRMVILDYGLEGLEAPALCRLIRKNAGLRYTYVIFYSEHQEHEKIVAAFEAGADDYLFKPFNPQLLKIRIQTGKRMLNLEDELRTMASYDSLTGLISYATFQRFFQTFLAGAIRHDMGGTVMFLHVRNYADVHRDFGDLAASKLMVEVARSLAPALRSSDLVAKVDDDQFCALLPQTLSEKLSIVLNNLRTQLADASVTAGAERIEPQIDVSFAVYPVQGLDAREILDEANRQQMGPLSGVLPAASVG